jgi:hypothetical protein
VQASLPKEDDMKEHPILFSGPMVRAILEGRKTQTRRPIKPQPRLYCSAHHTPDDGGWSFVVKGSVQNLRAPWALWDLLWVRETWAVAGIFDSKAPSKLPSWLTNVHYAPDGKIGEVGRVRSSIHMPRRFSRITLRVISIGIEELRKITDADVALEGFESREELFVAWDAMYSKRPELQVARRPWVWVTEFEVMT